MKYAIIDIETTGGNPVSEKITEIAIYIHDGEKIIDEFVSLVNPERPIPAFITGITGITNEMVADAPKFFEIAKPIIEITEDTIFVAHNVSFDYRFVKNEFKSLGYNYQRNTLDTVQLSRKLLPGHASYSLGKICTDLNIRINGRHRAAGDAFATVSLFEILLKKNGAFFNDAKIEQYKLLKGIDTALHKSLINKLPEETGVYYFFDSTKRLIYIGKSKNIKNRVIQHLKASTGQKAIEMKQNIHDITYEITGSELIALLLESDEIKKHKPIYNRQQRRTMFPIGLFSKYNFGGYIVLNLERITAKSEVPIATFANMEEAKNMLFKWIESYQLCQKLSGLYNSSHECFDYNIKKCKGACIEKEPSELYNRRVMKLIESLNYTNTHFFIIDKGRQPNEKAVVEVKNGNYMGYGFIDTEYSPTIQILGDCIKKYPDNRDIKQIIKGFLRTNTIEKLIYAEK